MALSRWAGVTRTCLAAPWRWRAEPTGRIRLRRHDPPRRAAARYRVGIRGGGRACRRQAERCPVARNRAHVDPRSGQLRWHVYGQYHGLGHRSPGTVAAGSSAQEAVSEAKRLDCEHAGAAVVRLIESGIRPRDILTRKAFENAITVSIALGGSTNAVPAPAGHRP